MVTTFTIVKKTNGLRVSREEELEGLDPTEHGLPSAYDGFSMAPEHIIEDGTSVPAVSGDIPVAEAVEVKSVPSFEAPRSRRKEADQSRNHLQGSQTRKLSNPR